MNNVASDEEGQGGCSPKTIQPSCCQPAGGNRSSCCAPEGSSWRKGKTLIALIIIIAAIGVGAHSLVKGAATRTELANPASSCSPQCGVAPGQSEKPGCCPSQSSVAACPTAGGKETSTQATPAPPSPCCPGQSPSGAAPGQQQRN